ncbi:hypothetical protein [Acaryochloris sp. CCMEE 5410]|uniref:hypothetical protein n=1 Tax=Acaryochloris sp. CCMEE 5410 TaxID=310037 RepID=UPI000248416F|nr:hypothetical protein [Acaryochloris sp. CCMEE 5410]KAI9129809.1 hypothetical protein ON05_032300 [Acaryochloris sp. CCMEE 5410]
MSDKVIFSPTDLSKEVSVLQKQLTIALKFHHSQTLEKLPKEVAIQVMEDVWDSCHPEAATNKQASDVYDEVPLTKVGTIFL